MRSISFFFSISLFSVLILFVPAGYAAQSVNLREQPDDLSAATAASPQSLFALPSASAENLEIQEVSKEKDAQGNTHIHTKQTYLGYPVWGAQKFIHISSKGDTTENGTIFHGLKADLQDTPSYIFKKAQADLATQKALDLYAKKSVKVQVPAQQESQLMVYVDETKKKAHWVFQVEFYFQGDNTISPSNPFYLLDAKTFEIYKEWDGMQYFDAVKVGGLGGNPKIGMITYDGSPANKPLLDMERDNATGTCYLQNTHVTIQDGRTVDFVNDSDGKAAAIMSFKCDQVDPAHGNIYWDGALDEVNGAWSPGNDALFLADKVNSMYEDWYHIPVFADPKDKSKLKTIKILVHDKALKFDLGGIYWGGENAAWVPNMQELRIGDGIDLFSEKPLENYYSFAVPDIIAHELTHAFSSQHAGLIGFGMSGGINESFSDMASKAFEYYLTGQNIWAHGADMRKDNKANRYMDDPTKDCQEDNKKCSIDNAKNYQERMNPHYSAGVFNKAFYLLSTSSGWNTRKAFDVMVQANRYHWTSEYLEFQEAACGVWDAANDLSYSKADLAVITKAMSQVGLESSETKCHPWSMGSIWSWITGNPAK